MHLVSGQKIKPKGSRREKRHWTASLNARSPPLGRKLSIFLHAHTKQNQVGLYSLSGPTSIGLVRSRVRMPLSPPPAEQFPKPDPIIFLYELHKSARKTYLSEGCQRSCVEKRMAPVCDAVMEKATRGRVGIQEG